MNKLLLLLGAMLMCSCSVTQPAWEGTKKGVSTVIGTGETAVSTIWNGGKELVGTGIETVEGVVTGAADVATDPFTEDNE
jgi:hypothetical protein